MSKRAQARVMALFAERQVSRQKTPAFEPWMEHWYYDGACSDWARTSCDFLAMRLHRRLRALKCMSDDQYVQVRKNRCFHERELEPRIVGDRFYSARAYQIHDTRELLRSLESRLASVVNALPQVWGYAVDQDHFDLRMNGRRWYVNWRFASYISLEKRLMVYKEIRSIERAHEERRRKERREEWRAKQYPELIRRLRELEARVQ